MRFWILESLVLGPEVVVGGERSAFVVDLLDFGVELVE